MKIEMREIPLGQVADGWFDDDEGGVRALGGALDVRPPFQREFVYKDKQRDAVVRSAKRGFPINVMYWTDVGTGRYEVLDGQQRTISLCRYLKGDFSVDGLFFHNLPSDVRAQLENYKLMVYVCDGPESERLDWFKTINVAGEKLTDQELRNAVFTGPWLADAKRWFSKKGGPAHGIAEHLVSAVAERQEYLEKALQWISNGDIETYMGKHQRDPNASALWLHFQNVVAWVDVVFTVRRPEMRGVDWGSLYRDHKDASLDFNEMERRVSALMEDDEVTNKRGVYPYLLTGEERHLNLRAFTKQQRREAYERQGGICPLCSPPRWHDIADMEGDHIDPWHSGGRTSAENCKMLCKPCNRRKSGK